MKEEGQIGDDSAKKERGRKAEMEGEMEGEGAKESMTGEREWRTRREIWLPSYDDVMEIERAEKSKSQVILMLLRIVRMGSFFMRWRLPLLGYLFD